MKQLNIFDAVKQSVPIRQAASFYGIRINKNGKALCPFHDDHNPSLQFYDDHFYCFGCGAAGDVVTLAAMLFSLPPLEAAKKLAEDFFVPTDSLMTVPCQKELEAATAEMTEPDNQAEQFSKKRFLFYFTYCDYSELLRLLLAMSAPKPGEEMDDCFIFCCHELSRVEQYLDILQPGSLYPEEDMAALIKEKGKEAETIHAFINDYRF